MMTFFSKSYRAILTAWVLRDLMHNNKGYAVASDELLSGQTNIGLRALQKTMTRLHSEGAIVRVHVHVGKTSYERRIYPGLEIVERWKTARTTRFVPRHDPRHAKRHEPRGAVLLNKEPRGGDRSETRTQHEARLDAERRHRRRGREDEASND